jgi:hypothetical protein
MSDDVYRKSDGIGAGGAAGHDGPVADDATPRPDLRRVDGDPTRIADGTERGDDDG